MITDSPYESGTLVLKPFEGVLAGFLGSFLMMGMMFVLQPFSSNDVVDTLAKLGGFIPGNGVGVGVFLLICGGSIFGVLYALCEQRIPVKGLIGDGLFYGFFIWVLLGLILSAFLGEEARGLLRTWTFLVELLVYGLCLASFSIFATRYRSGGSTLPRD